MLVKGIVAVEPQGPPLENVDSGARARPWGLTHIAMRYEPTITDPSELQVVKDDKLDGPDLVPCWRQREPARKLSNLQTVPVLIVTSEASYHAPYDHCNAAWLTQAGVKTTHIRLENLGLHGNGHMMMVEKNSLQIARYIEGWIRQNVH